MRRLVAQSKRRRLPTLPLEAYRDVKLQCYERNEEIERYRGYATHPSGDPVLLLVDYPLEDGERVPMPEDPGGVVRSLLQWPVDPFGAAIDLEALPGESPESM